MSIRLSRLATGILVVAAMVLTSGRSWAIFNELGPSKDDWGLKYDVQVNDVDRDTLSVVFTLADEGRLKPFYKVELIAFNPQTDSQGGHGYDVKTTIEFKTADDGRRVGQVQIRKEFAGRAKFRILTETVDGRRQPKWLACYLIPLNRFLDNAQAPAAPLASPPPSRLPR